MVAHSIIESDLNEKVYFLYQSLRVGDGFPSWNELQSAAFEHPRELPYLYVVDVIKKDGDIFFQFRLMGSKLVETLKHEGTGMFVRELPLGGWEKVFRETILHAYQSRRPAIAVDVLKHRNGLAIELEHMALPLADDGTEISQMMGAVAFLGIPREDVSKLSEKIDWDQIEAIDVPKRLLISNLAIPFGHH